MEKRNNSHGKCNNRFLSKEQITAKAKTYRHEHNQQKRKLKVTMKKLEKAVQSCDPVNEEDNEDLTKLPSAAKTKIALNSPLKMFLQVQLKAAKRESCHGFKWHPTIVKWCLYIYKMSAATYRAVRDSGFLVHLSERKLQDFGSTFTSDPDFPTQLPLHVQSAISNLQGH